MSGSFKLSISLVFLLGVSGCVRHGERRPDPDLAGPASKLLPSVPFYPDSTDQCGPSTLAAVMNYWNHPVRPDELRSEIYLPKLKGTLPMDLLPAVEARGFQARVYQGSLDNIRQEINAGRPLLAYLNLGYSFYPKGHYILITGYNDDKKGVYAHSGKNPNQFFSYKKLLKSWNKTDRWTLLVQPPEEKRVEVNQ